MTDAPAPPPTLRPALPDDAPALARLEEVCMRARAEALWGAWQPRPPVIEGCEIILCGDAEAGCIACRTGPDRLVVDRLYLWPAWQGRGLGARVPRGKMALAAALDLPVRLSVLTTNPALRFYLREGFVVDSETAERRQMVWWPPGPNPRA